MKLFTIEQSPFLGLHRSFFLIDCRMTGDIQRVSKYAVTSMLNFFPSPEGKKDIQAWRIVHHAWRYARHISVLGIAKGSSLRSLIKSQDLVNEHGNGNKYSPDQDTIKEWKECVLEFLVLIRQRELDILEESGIEIPQRNIDAYCRLPAPGQDVDVFLQDGVLYKNLHHLMDDCTSAYAAKEAARAALVRPVPDRNRLHRVVSRGSRRSSDREIRDRVDALIRQRRNGIDPTSFFEIFKGAMGEELLELLPTLVKQKGNLDFLLDDVCWVSCFEGIPRRLEILEKIVSKFSRGSKLDRLIKKIVEVFRPSITTKEEQTRLFMITTYCKDDDLTTQLEEGLTWEM